MVVLSNTKKRNVSDEFKFSKGVWYITDTSIFLTLSIIKPDGFIIGTLYELRRVSGCVSVREWMQSQVNEQTNEDLHLDFDNMDFHRTNPANRVTYVRYWCGISVVIHMVIVQNDMMSES